MRFSFVLSEFRDSCGMCASSYKKAGKFKIHQTYNSANLVEKVSTDKIFILLPDGYGDTSYLRQFSVERVFRTYGFLSIH